MFGISSGLVPLILMVRQLFQEVYRFSILLQNLISGIDELGTKLAVQQTIFESGSRLLLYLAARSRHDVDNMYDDMEHPMWKHRKTDQDLEKTLALSRTPCLHTLQRIQKNLSECRGQLLSLKEREKRKGKNGQQLWRTQFWSKMPSSDPAEQFPPVLKDLRECNDIFCTFVRQIVQNQPKAIPSPSLLRTADEASSLPASRLAWSSDSHILCYQRASQDLYESLSEMWSCHEASEHSLNMALDFDDPKGGGPSSSESIRFRLSLKTAMSSRPFQVAVDSTESIRCSCLGAEGSPFLNLPQVGISEDRLADSIDIRTPTPLRGSPKVASAYRAKHPNLGAGTRSRQPEHSTYDSEHRMYDLDQGDKLCHSLERLWCAMDTYMSGMETFLIRSCDTGGTMQSHSLNYLGRELHEQCSTSLDDVLMQAKSRRLAIAPEDKLRLAVSLATGVLYLHSTSWIPQRWGSKDIMIPENDHSNDGIRLKDPFLHVHLERSTIDYSVTERIAFTSVHSPLFYLGIVLLELAFSAPLRELHVHEDFTSGLVKRERDYLTVARLSETVSRELGSRYSKVVRTCFPQIFRPREVHSLRKQELDDIIADHVVKELEQSLRAVLSVEKGEHNNC